LLIASFSGGLQTAVVWAALVSSLVAIVGVFALRRQLRQSERSLLGSTSQFCYGAMSALLQVQIDKPHLRPFIYESKPLPVEGVDDDLREQVLALAANYADFFDAVLLQGALGNVSVYEYINVWKRFIDHMLSASPIIREYCLSNPTWYSPELVALAQSAAPVAGEPDATES